MVTDFYSEFATFAEPEALMPPHLHSPSSRDRRSAIRLLDCKRVLAGLALTVVLPVNAELQNLPAKHSETPKEYYAAPGGKGIECARGAPCSLAFALSSNHSPLAPGDTLWLRGGIYRGTFKSYLHGTADFPVIVRQIPGERAIIDGGNSNSTGILTIIGTYTWFWGFEIMSSDPIRVSSQANSWPTDIPRGEGVVFDQAPGHGVGTKLINLVIHDTRQGISFWKEAEDSEISGCIIFDNGWDGPPDDRAHGHGIYVQNQTGTKRISDNIIFHQFSHGIHAYGSRFGPVMNLNIEGNILFDNGVPSAFGMERNVLVGGGSVAQNIKFVNNYTYGGTTKFGYTARVDALTVEDNYLATRVEMNAPKASVHKNTLLQKALNGFSADEYPDNVYLANPPTGLHVFIERNHYESHRATIVVYNWDKKRSVSLDLSQMLTLGEPFEIRDVQNYLGAPIATGIYTGRPAAIDIAPLHQVMEPVGFVNRVDHTNADFNVFVVTSIPKTF
jgi:hypothetical protein